MLTRREALTRIAVGGVGTGSVLPSRVLGEPQHSERAAVVSSTDEERIHEHRTIRYRPSDQQFAIEYQYDLPDSLTGLRITSRQFAAPYTSVTHTVHLDPDGDTAYDWDGEPSPVLALAVAVKGSTLTDGSPGYVTDEAAFGRQVIPRYSWQYRSTGNVTGVERSITFDGTGSAGSGYAYAGSHDRSRQVTLGIPQSVIVTGGVDREIDAADILDVFALGERQLQARTDYHRTTAFVFPDARRGTAPPATTFQQDLYLTSSSAAVDSIDTAVAHEYCHTIFGVFGTGDVHWLTEGTAEYEKGAHVLGALDGEIRRRSDGRRTLVDVVGTEEEDEAGALTTYDGFVDRVTRAAGDESLADWVHRYVRTAALPAVPTDPERYTLGDYSPDRFRTATHTPTPTHRSVPTVTEPSGRSRSPTAPGPRPPDGPGHTATERATTRGNGPGFGPAAGLVALVLGAGFARLREEKH